MGVTLFDRQFPAWLDDDVLTRIAWLRLVDPSGTAALAARQRYPLQQIISRLWTGDTDGDDHLKALSRSAGRRLAVVDPVRDLHNTIAMGARVVVPDDPEWPEPLRDMDAAPVCLWFKGPARPDWGRSIAIVGSRASTAYGEAMACTLASGVAREAVTVVSGGAMGIDYAAHRSALMVGGSTVAVLAGGLDNLYPRQNEAILREIGQHQLLISRTPPGTTNARHLFLERNWVIAALTRATVVVEAGWRSGAQNTASHAGTLGRNLGAVPGPVTSTMSAGCHRLLRNSNATCITDAEELMELAGLGSSPDTSWNDGGVHDPVDLRVYDAIAPGRQRTVDSLADETRLEPRQVRAALGRLELSGHVRISAGLWARKRPPKPSS